MRSDAVGLPITLDLDGRRAVLVGPDDEERRRKQVLLEDARAQLHIVLPEQFSAADVTGALVVMVSARDADLAARVSVAARAAGALVWCSDDPARSDFAMPAIARLGRARIATSTSGGSPALARKIRLTLEQALGEPFARFLDVLARLRDQVQRDEPDEEQRRKRLNEALDGFELTIDARYPDWIKSASP